ncbi:MAG: RluA family pseudouridine synthase [Patescibacteria group bacterium]
MTKTELKILYEDASCMVIDKPAGIVVHPGENGKYVGKTISDAVLHKISKGLRKSDRPGIVHRLDKDTSGVLIVAKTLKGYENLVQQFKERQVRKIYFALVFGKLKYPEGIIDSPIGRNLNDRKKMWVQSEEFGRKAVSQYKVVKEFNVANGIMASLIEVKIETGRTHQIRVHMSAIGHPVIMDSTYGKKKINVVFGKKFGLGRQFLHAHEISFIYPKTKKTVLVRAELSDDLKDVLEKLGSLA